jgi:hypothetical protein
MQAGPATAFLVATAVREVGALAPLPSTRMFYVFAEAEKGADVIAGVNVKKV